uniref:TLDc domain-containing protein n=1 Tax=Lygus hesperus TaxID=30085 RepID=A0A0A9Z5Z9_LYGHE
MGDEARDEELAVVNLEHVKRISDTFRPNTVKKNGSIQKTVVQEIWKNRLAPRFYSAMMSVMFPGDAKEVSFLSFYTIYKNLAEPEAEIVFRALTIYHIATIHEPPFNYEQADEYPNAPLTNIKAYVCDVITSYLHSIIHINMKEPLGWLELKASNSIMEGNLVAAYLLKDLESHRNEVSIGSLEIWLEKSEIYYTVSVELYLYLFGVNKTIDVKSLVPFPIVQTGKNSRTLMSLPDVLLLNSKLPKRAPRWTLAFMLDSRTGDWEKFKQAIYGKGQTLIVIQDSNGDIFGMYGSQQWVPSSGFYGNDQSFLFTLKPDVNVYESSGRNKNFQIFTDTGIGLGGTEASPGLFINWTLRVGTTSPRCVTFDKFWQLSRDLVFDIRLLELWVVNEVLSRKNTVIPRDFYNTVVMWSKVGHNKLPSNVCQCGNGGCGSSQAQIEETDLKYFQTSDDSSEELCIGDCVATQTSKAPSVHSKPNFRTRATYTSCTGLDPESIHNLRDNCCQTSQDNYRKTSQDLCHQSLQYNNPPNLKDDIRPPLQGSASPIRRTVS